VLVLFAMFEACHTGWSAEVAKLKDLFGISGTARVSFFTKDNSFTNAPGVQNDSLWLTARPSEVAGIRTYFDARVQGQFVSGNSKVSSDLREGYFETTHGDFDFKVGRQIIVWGRADKINPTDVWSVRNYRLLATDDDDQRLGLLAMQAVWNTGSYHARMIWQPEWRTPVLPLPPLPEGTSLVDFVASNKAGQVGWKLDHSGSGMDWSVSYAHCINRTPDLTLLAVRPQGTALGLAYNFADVVGADAAIPIGRYGLRGEVAYTQVRNNPGLNPLAQASNLFVVLGVERTWDGVLNVNVQYLFRKAFDYRGSDSIADPGTRSLAEQAQLISNQISGNMQGASLRIDRKAFNETLELELGAAMWINKRDSIVTMKLSYAFTDRIKGIVGANIWSGPADSFFGRLSHATTAFIEVRYGL
jgi:hypothetical protein